MLDFPGKLATAVIVMMIAFAIILAAKDIGKAYWRGGMTAALFAAVGCGVVVFVIAHILDIPGIADDTVKQVERQSDKVKSKVRVGGSLYWDGSRLLR